MQHIFISPVPEEEDINLLLDILTNISHLLIATNSSFNIVVYVLKVRRNTINKLTFLAVTFLIVADSSKAKK